MVFKVPVEIDAVARLYGATKAIHFAIGTRIATLANIPILPQVFGPFPSLFKDRIKIKQKNILKTSIGTKYFRARIRLLINVPFKPNKEIEKNNVTKFEYPRCKFFEHLIFYVILQRYDLHIVLHISS